MAVFIQYAMFSCVVSALGIGLAVPALLVAQVVPKSFVVAFMACVIAFLILDNWTLAKDLQSKSQPLARPNNVSFESMHWNLLAHKAVALNQIKNKRIRRSVSCML